MTVCLHMARMLLAITGMLSVHFLFHFQFWDVEKYVIPDEWEVIFPNIPIECGVIHSNVYWFFDCSGQTIVLPSYYLEIFYRCFMATDTLVLEYWWWGLQMFLVPFPKWSSWLTNVFFPTVNASTGVAVNYTILIGDFVLIFGWQ